MGFVSIEAKCRLEDEDPVFTLDLETTNLSQIELSFLSFNDPFCERFNIDHDDEGRKNFLATGRRNIKEEERALAAGLFPGQVRKGLGLLRDFFELIGKFLQPLDCELYLLEPLFYHNAITYERYGCGYLEGKSRMEKIHQGFAPGGELYDHLDGSSPFRQRGFEKTVQGRSWAIHDGILLGPWKSPKLYKNIGQDLGVSTFPDSIF
jgi:acetoin utilization protein AcuC